MKLQDDINAIAYPPSHTYELTGLKPTGSLAERVEVIEKDFSNFFCGGELLDVGCNKGFFSQYHKGGVVGIDPMEECITLCKKLYKSGEFYQATFKEYTTRKKFARVFIGNGHHYPFIDAGGWTWVEKLGNLTHTGGFVLLEGPTGMEGRDAQNCIPEELASEFTQSKLLEAFDPLFILRGLVPSPLTDRYFLLFEKRDSDDIYQKYLQTLYYLASNYIHPTDVVMEVCTRHDRGVLGEKIIPHKEYIFVDKADNRPGLSLDVLVDDLPSCDVVVSTAIFHHTAPENLGRLFNNLVRNTKYKIIISGPADDMGVELYGDHLYHLNPKELSDIANLAKWELAYMRRVGLKYCTPYEWFFVFSKVPQI